MRWIEAHMRQNDGLLIQSPPPPPPSSSSGNKSSSAVLFARDIIIIVAVIFFISGVLHLLVRFLMKKRSSSSSSNSQSNRNYPERAGSETFQRQLQQLFHLHDSGLDQAFIDALPVFLYKELMGLKEPFDCAVCLCEFSEQDKLRLLPLCSHAFHIHCIDTWLLSNSTCPLCRGTLFTPGFSIENPMFDFDDYSRDQEENGFSGNTAHVGVSCNFQKQSEDGNVGEKRVYPVRLGKFRSTSDEKRGDLEREVGETSNSNFDARRCYSMGSFQYVVANSDLQVAFSPNRANGNDVRVVKERRLGQNGNSSIVGDTEGKKINIGSKGESFSVSKIWLWPKKGKFPSPSDDSHMVNSSVNVSLPLRDI